MEAIAQQPNPVLATTPGEINWSNKTILIADDVKINYILLKALLGKTKANILWAEDGEKAIEYCKSQNNIDLVLMDYNMPKMDGCEATRIIKEFRSDLPVISQTTCALGTHEFDEMTTTCDDYILKPIDKTKLIHTISKHLKK